MHNLGGPARALKAGLALTLCFAAFEVVAGLLAGSLALIADAGHMLVDSAGLLLALVATFISRRPSDLRRTYGYARVEVLVVPLHVLLMLGLSAYIVYAAVGRSGESPQIEWLPVLFTGAVGLVLNFVVLRLLQGHAHDNLNARSAMFEVTADALGSIGVIVSAVVIGLAGWTEVDVVVSLVIAALIVPRALLLLRPVLSILLEGSPPGVSIEAIQVDARKVPGVTALHDLHVWALAPSFAALSAHVEVVSMHDCESSISELTALLRLRHGITHVTLQPETRDLHYAIECCKYPDAVPTVEHVH
jgi:cobalt-zinc-cadmium efflux system protein